VYWSHVNENVWQLANDQVASTWLGLQAADPSTVERISITTENGISAIAFAFKEPLDSYREETLEVAMDSMCKLVVLNVMKEITDFGL
jgi:hypothetical protein